MTTETSPAPSAAIADLAERLLRHLLEASPLNATLIGFREYDDRLSDLSAAAESRRAEERARIRDEAVAIDPDGLTSQEAVTRSVIIAQADYGDDEQTADALEYTVAAFPVAPASILLAYLRMIVLTDEPQADAYLARLRTIPAYLAQAEERLAAGRATGLTPVAHLVDMAVDQIDRFLTADPSPLLISPPPGAADPEAWTRSVSEVVAAVVNPAFRRHAEVLRDDVLPTARDNEAVGLVHLPGGAERYRALVRLHTTTSRTPEELHHTGLEMVAAIHDEFRALGQTMFDLGNVREIFARLLSDPALRWTSEQQILDAAEVAVRRAEAASVDWFGRLPEAVCVLEAIPELEAAGAPPAYYMEPALDGSRPGTYYTNTSQPQERTSFDLESVAYHEAVPGHHFQISIALELPDLPVLRRLTLFTAYAEGWGLYSERLADEMGLYSSELQRMGMLSADVWRAARLVVDTGMHAFGWSRQRAVDYLLEATPVAPIDVEAEIDRYIAMPAQALSYMAGRTEIESLRRQAEERLGSRFDIRAFHDAVLGSGALPLAVLADVLAAWLTDTEGAHG